MPVAKGCIFSRYFECGKRRSEQRHVFLFSFLKRFLVRRSPVHDQDGCHIFQSGDRHDVLVCLHRDPQHSFVYMSHYVTQQVAGVAAGNLRVQSCLSAKTVKFNSLTKSLTFIFGSFLITIFIQPVFPPGLFDQAESMFLVQLPVLLHIALHEDAIAELRLMADDVFRQRLAVGRTTGPAIDAGQVAHQLAYLFHLFRTSSIFPSYRNFGLG